LEMMVCDEGKGGKINGIGRKIKEMWKKWKIVGVEKEG
jgi:cysteine synthase